MRASCASTFVQAKSPLANRVQWSAIERRTSTRHLALLDVPDRASNVLFFFVHVGTAVYTFVSSIIHASIHAYVRSLLIPTAFPRVR